jgi:DNA-binding transcriptional MerR regulator
MPYYTTSQASEITGASIQIIRIYTRLYARHFSTEATPEPGQARRFTAADLRLIKFAHQLSRQNITREQVAERLAAGELEHFEWWPPEPPESESQAEKPASEPGTALVPLERLQAAQALLQDAQRREQAASEQAQALQAQVSELQRELGKAQGELQGYRAAQYKAPKWWRSIFGGRAGE